VADHNLNGHKRNLRIQAVGPGILLSIPWELVAIDYDEKTFDFMSSPEGSVAIANAIINQVNSIGEAPPDEPVS
jgi:hypothetical protein